MASDISDDTPIFKTHALLDVPGASHGFFTRQGGVSKGLYESLNAGQGSDDEPLHVLENRQRIARAIGAHPRNLLSLHQHHSTDVTIIDTPISGTRPKADGLVTKIPGLAISALAADCGPVLMIDPENHVIGACHAGWRGALAGITDQTVLAMETIGANRAHIRAVLGPCIGQTAYEVGPDFRDSFVAEDEAYDRFFKLGPSKEHGERRPHFDLKAFILARLRAVGIAQAEALPDCTYSEPQVYYSYRYNTHQGKNDYGRNISVIMLTE